MSDEVIEVNLEEEVNFLRDWASKNKVVFEDEGECGFGRECVGITSGGSWVDLGPSVENDGYTWSEIVEGADAPEGVDAYHKHDCLAVLGRGPEAIHQLYRWVKQISENGLVVKRAPRKPRNQFDLLLHGIEYVFLDHPEGWVANNQINGLDAAKARINELENELEKAERTIQEMRESFDKIDVHVRRWS